MLPCSHICMLVLTHTQASVCGTLCARVCGAQAHISSFAILLMRTFAYDCCGRVMRNSCHRFLYTGRAVAYGLSKHSHEYCIGALAVVRSTEIDGVGLAELIELLLVQLIAAHMASQCVVLFFDGVDECEKVGGTVAGEAIFDLLNPARSRGLHNLPQTVGIVISSVQPWWAERPRTVEIVLPTGSAQELDAETWADTLQHTRETLTAYAEKTGRIGGGRERGGGAASDMRCRALPIPQNSSWNARGDRGPAIGAAVVTVGARGRVPERPEGPVHREPASIRLG